MTNNVFPAGPGIAYGGERIVWYLVDALAKMGHTITFISRGGTIPPKNVNLLEVPEMVNDRDVYYDMAKMYLQITKGGMWDIYQCNYFGEGYNPNIRNLAEQTCELVWNAWCHREPFFHKKPEAENIISYSKVLQGDLSDRGVKSTMIHYGLPKDLYQFSPDHDGYAVWIGKIEGGKRPDLAIQLALAAGLKIVIMGPPYNTTHFWQQVCPWIDNERVFWVRGVDDEQKQRIMRRAKVFISSNDNSWKEHFGIVNIEALACGVPIIAFNRINQECAIYTDRIIEDGVHGFFLNYHDSNNVDEIITTGLPLVKSIEKIDREACRGQFERKFTADLMAKRYVYFYEHILKNRSIENLEIPF